MSDALYTPKPDPEAMAKVQHVWDWYFNVARHEHLEDSMDSQLMKDLKLIDARLEGRSVFSLTVPRYLGNLADNLHGGGAALLLDMCTMSALAPLAKKNFWAFLGGPTRSMNLSYLRNCPVGTPIIIDSYVQQVGRTMALIRGEIKSPDGKTLYVVVDHHKVNHPPWEAALLHEPEPKLKL